MSSSTQVLPSGHGPEAPRRDFLKLVTSATAVVGVGAVIWALVDSMEPASDTLAEGAPIDVDLTKLTPGQQIVVVWRGKPILVVNRTPQAIASLKSPKVLELLSDPNSRALQQPPYAQNWHRSIKPEWAVLVGICTHLGCLPNYFPNPSATDPVTNWPGGYFCPCHGSKYDLAGRVWSGVPAPLNLPVPPYNLPDPKTVRIGENPPGQTFDLGSVEQL